MEVAFKEGNRDGQSLRFHGSYTTAIDDEVSHQQKAQMIGVGSIYIVSWQAAIEYSCGVAKMKTRSVNQSQAQSLVLSIVIH